MKNILIISSSYPSISEESFEGACVEVFARELARLGNHVTILTQCTNKSYYKDSPYLSVRRFQWSDSAKPLSTLSLTSDFGNICRYFYNGLRQAEKIIKENHIHLTICAWAVPSGLFGLYLKQRFNIPYTIWALGSDIWSYSKNLLSSSTLKYILSHASAIYADGISLVHQIEVLTKKEAKFLSSSRILPQIKSSSIFFKPNRVNFIYVGRYHTNKGPDILIEAIRLISSRLQHQSYFHFFGVGDMREYLETIIKNHNLNHIVTLNGPINIYTLSQYLEMADFIVIPSRIESIPVILSDALQKKCPIVATNVGDVGTLMTKYQVGYLAQKADPDHLAEVLSHAIIEKESFIDGMEALYQTFDPQLNAKRFMENLDELLG